MTRFYVIRHCEAQGNRERRFQGTFDGAVSELGRKQLDYLSLRFRNEHIDAIFSSSRTRALETAKAVNRFHNLEIQIDDRVMEINAGEWEGKLFTDFPKLFPKEMELWDNAPYDFVAPGGESMRAVYERMSEFFLQTAASHENETVVVVSHGCAIRNLLCWAEQLGFENLGKEVWCANTAVNVIEIENGQPRLLLKNDISHLPQEMQTLSSQKWNRES